jgi:NAD(P)-dependent dehydrogenase (short-subunit alcohol dehydrogenase family)
VLRVNLTGVFLCMKYELSEMVPRGAGAIVNTSSSAGLYALPGMPAYVASKHCLVGLSKAAAVDYGQYGIRVNCLCPSSTLTPMYESVASGTDLAEVHATATPLGRLAQAEEIAEAAVWLCAAEASYVTALTMSLDGGRRA